MEILSSSSIKMFLATYQEFTNQILQLQDEGLELFNAGKSVLGKNLLATHVGDYSGPQVLIQGGIHAREYITSLLMVEQARNLHNNNLVKDDYIFSWITACEFGAEEMKSGITGYPVIAVEIIRGALSPLNITSFC